MADRNRVLTATIAALVAVTAVVGFVVYMFALREPANHPQLDVASAAVTRLNAGADPSSVLPARQVEIGSSDLFVMVLDTNGSVLATSAHLNGQTVVPPAGVFDYVRTHGDDRITWQPAPGVRSAIVVEQFGGGFVVAGRTLSDGENLEGTLVRLSIAGWFAIVFAGVVVLVYYLRKPRES